MRFDDLRDWLQLTLGIIIAAIGALAGLGLTLWRRVAKLEGRGEQLAEIRELRQRPEKVEAKLAR
jgi:hypothetical protein